MNVKELIDNKKDYFESEREFGEEINQFIRSIIKEVHPNEYHKNYYIKIDFNEIGKYGDYEVEITSVADYLTDEVIGALVREYDLIVTYKCSQTGFNLGTGEVNRDKKVFFKYAGEETLAEPETEEDTGAGEETEEPAEDAQDEDSEQE